MSYTNLNVGASETRNMRQRLEYQGETNDENSTRQFAFDPGDSSQTESNVVEFQ